MKSERDEIANTSLGKTAAGRKELLKDRPSKEESINCPEINAA